LSTREQGSTVRTRVRSLGVAEKVPMFLSDEELEHLTGTKQPSKMIKWLRSEGFTFRVASNGRPVVSADHVKQVLSGSAPSRRQKPEVKLDWINKEKRNGSATSA